MSFSLRSLSARRYRIEGDLPSVESAAFAERLLARPFAPLSAHEERAFGWVTADNCLDARFAPGSVARGPCAVFALRVDKRRVNSRLLRAMIDLELRGRAKDRERDTEGGAAVRGDPVRGDAAGDGRGARGPGRVSRDERAELRKALTAELLRNTHPTMEVHPVLVYPRDRLVLFGSLGKPANEVFRALFCDTFDVSLSVLTPYHRALELLASRGGGQALAGLSSTDFASTTGGAVGAVGTGAAGRDAVPESVARRAGRAEEVTR